MSLQCGIVGLPNVGKSTLFNALTKAGIAAENYPFCTIEPNIGIGHPGDPQAVTDYVLHKPSAEDRAEIDAAIARSLEVLPLALAGDLQGAMLKLHTVDKPQAPAKPAEPAKPAKAEKSAKAGDRKSVV